MTDLIKPILSVLVTTADRLPDLSIKNGQLIFIENKHKIALDFKNKRTFYNQIVVLQTDNERVTLESPETEVFYFVIETCVLWYYGISWNQITTSPEEIVFIGTTLPEIGSTKTLYIDKTNKTISIWDDESNNYDVISEKVIPITDDEINSLFN